MKRSEAGARGLAELRPPRAPHPCRGGLLFILLAVRIAGAGKRLEGGLDLLPDRGEFLRVGTVRSPDLEEHQLAARDVRDGVVAVLRQHSLSVCLRDGVEPDAQPLAMVRSDGEGLDRKS